MPQNTATAARNQEIRAWADTNATTTYGATYRAEFTASNCTAAIGLSTTTVANILRGRDLNPPPSMSNRSSRRRALAGSASRALGDSRRFGVEIEFLGIARTRVEAALRSGDLPSGWSVKSDLSVHGGSGYGLELVSPPLRGEDGIDSVRRACRWLRENGASVNSSCGLHVHHEARDLGAPGIARVARIYTDHQELLNWLVSPSRRGGASGTTFAQPMARRDIEFTESHLPSLVAHTRYLAVNVNSYGRHGTVELRQHQGTLNTQKVEAWIRLGQGLCDAAAEQTRVSETGLRGLLQRLRVDEDAAAFLLGRALQFNAPSSAVGS